MPIINKAAIVPYSRQQMFDLVNDIQNYPEFVPWCINSKILYQNRDEIRATLCFAKGGIQKSFTTLNRLHAPKMTEIRLIDGPFRQLEGFWQFEGDDAGCEVKLSLEFEFSSGLWKVIFGPVFHQVAHMLVEAFTQRAQQIYG